MNNVHSFGLYSALSRIFFIKFNYMFKIALVVLLASFTPLLAVFSYFMLLGKSIDILFIPLFLSVITVGLNIFLLYLLLKPIFFTIKQLDAHINHDMPLHLHTDDYKDEIGLLMEHIHYMAQKLEFLNRAQNIDSNLDPLTGVLNRVAGEERLRQDIARASRDNSRLLVALLDIDNFSQINEHFGRHIGDVCLTHVAEVTMSNIRKGDWIARWGGDRFLMVLWNFNNGEPRIVLERIKKDSIHTPMNELLKLNLSIGACDYQYEVDIDMLLSKLNECMYQAKRVGHGGIEICQK